MSTLPCIGFKAQAVIEWEHEDEKHYLCNPDPPNAKIILKGHFDDDEALFQLRIPMQLKGVQTKTEILVHIYPENIISFSPDIPTPLPKTVSKKLKCPSTCLRFQLHQPADLIVPVTARTPPQPKRNPSGAVLDALRKLVRLRSFCIYVPSGTLDKADLDAIQRVLAQTPSKAPSRSLTSLFGDNTKGKVIGFTEDQTPPSYQDLEEPPPAPPANVPPKLHNERKRRRSDSPTLSSITNDTDRRFDAIMAEIAAIRSEKDEQIQQLEKRVRELEAEVTTLQGNVNDINSAEEEFDADLYHVKEDLRSVEASLADINEHGLDSDVEERILDELNDRVREYISSKTINTTIVFND